MRRRVQRLGNVSVILLLRSPLHRLASGSLVLISYRGRRSGRRFTAPVIARAAVAAEPEPTFVRISALEPTA